MIVLSLLYGILCMLVGVWNLSDAFFTKDLSDFDRKVSFWIGSIMIITGILTIFF